MKIVVDANVIIAALSRPAITSEVLLYPYIDYFTPDFFIKELKAHEVELKKKVGPTYTPSIGLDVSYIAAALVINADGL